MVYLTPFKNVLIMKGMPYSKHGVDRDPRRTFRTSKIFISEERRHYNRYLWVSGQRSEGGQRSTVSISCTQHQPGTFFRFFRNKFEFTKCERIGFVLHLSWN